MCVTPHWKQHIRWKTFEWACERWAALPFIFSSLSLSHFLSSPLSSPVSLSLLPSPRGPRVALPRGLAPNHPELVGGNRRLPAGCLVTADPWDTHTHTFLHTPAKHTHIQTHTTSYMLTKAFAVISWHLSIHVSPTTRSCQGHCLAT